jgi:hypothetical protein
VLALDVNPHAATQSHFILSRTTERSLRLMARKPNYGFEKRKKEQDRTAKKDAKREDRRRRREEARVEGEADSVKEPGQSGRAAPSV